MSAFLPAIEVCLSDAFYQGPDAIAVKVGQWVTCKGAKGRVTESDSLRVLWRLSGESFRSFNLRFKKALALRKGIKSARGGLRGIMQARQLSFMSREPSVLTLALCRQFRKLESLKAQYRHAEGVH